jgi:hypothetical protein
MVLGEANRKGPASPRANQQEHAYGGGWTPLTLLLIATARTNDGSSRIASARSSRSASSQSSTSWQWT